MGSIVIKGIRFHGHHGVTEEERQIGGHYEIDATLNLSFRVCKIFVETQV